MEENEILTSEDFMAESIEDLSAEMAESAEPSESEEAEGEQTVEQPEEPEAQNEEIDRNAIYAEARRVAEANARKAQKARDDEFVRRFGHLNNPITGQPIRSEADYLRALDAQEEMKAKAKLQESGIDPALIDNAVANNPIVRQAQSVMAQAQESQMMGRIFSDFAELKMIDPSINTLLDVPPDVINYIQLNAQRGREVNLVEAYKILNFGKVSESKQSAIRQSAINQAKGKQHLSPVNGVSTPDEGVEIPESELAYWKEAFPDASKAELKKKYNRTLQ